MAVVPPSIALAGTRMRLFNQEDPRSIWMFVEEYYTQEMILKVFNYFDLKPINIRFITERHSQKSAGYCFVDFNTAGECIHAMLRISGQKIPYTNPQKKFSVAFARNPHAPEVDFLVLVNNMPRDIDETELFKMFLSRYPSCRSARIMAKTNGMGSVRLADYYEQQQAKEDFQGMVIRGHTLVCSASDPRIKLPRQMEGNREGDAFSEHVYQQVRELEAARRRVELEKKLQAKMAKQEKREAEQRARIGPAGTPLPRPEERARYEAILYSPNPSVEEFNEYFMNCDGRLFRDIRDSRFMRSGLLIDANAMRDELQEHYRAESSDSDETWSRSSDDERDRHESRTKRSRHS